MIERGDGEFLPLLPADDDVRKALSPDIRRSAIVVVAALTDQQVVVDDLVDKSVLAIDAPRPPSGKFT